MSLPPPDSHSTIVVTGASAGIGEELARGLAARGYGLTLVARRRERLDALAEELLGKDGVTVDVIPCDLSSDVARSELLATLKGGGRAVVGVCNNAGFGSFGRFHELDLERETEMVRLNVGALHELTGAFLAEMVERGAGAVLNVASTASFQPLPANATYAATKAFVLSFSEALHTELHGTGVSVSAICPGPVKTEFVDVAGAGSEADLLPEFAWLSAAAVARAGIDAMLKGKRTVVPGIGNKATAFGGRYTPRAALLPLVERVYGRRFTSK